ncbi:MAG: zinc-ribbon domain containing protein [Nitrospinaceae bacterium]|nr:zinc-ribbon domain containing protein [Nitrospinaceae bacterium]
MSFEDKALQCADCGQEFTFTAGEQEFYASRGFQNEPRRCPDCRRSRKNQRYGDGGGGGGGYGSRAPRQMFSVVCAQCGTDTEVPFEPREDRPVYCSDCYNKIKLNR